MKQIFLSLAVALSMTNAAWADQLSTEKQRQLQNGNRKIWIGVGMMAAGAIIAPWTAVTTDGKGKNQTMRAGIGLVFVGSGVAWWGANERRRALDPQVKLGVSIGRSNAVFVRRTW